MSDEISQRDLRVLDLIFTTEANDYGDEHALKMSNDLASEFKDNSLIADEDDEKKHSEKFRNLTEQEVKAIGYAEKGEFKESEEILLNVIRDNPTYASAFNNLGQVKRMQEKYDEAITYFLRSIDLLVQKYEYLFVTSRGKATDEKAEFKNEKDKKRKLIWEGKVTKIYRSEVNVLSQAHTALGSIYLEKAKKARVIEEDEENEWTLREKASHHFLLGGKYGNIIGKKLGVAVNPYARLCGSMVRNAMEHEMNMQE